jgi:hypothetical protein
MLEPPADMSWELFTRIVDQLPKVARVVLHGVGGRLGRAFASWKCRCLIVVARRASRRLPVHFAER